MYCRQCGEPVSDNYYCCKFCGEPVSRVKISKSFYENPKKKRKNGCLVSAIVTASIILFIMVSIIIIAANDYGETKPNDTETTVTKSQKEEKKNYKVIYEDDYIKASFIRVYSSEMVDSVVKGVAYLQLHIENKSNMTFTVAMSKAAINGMTTTIGSGVPMVLLPGNSSEQPFILFTNNTGVNHANEIEQLQFSFFLLDENIKKIEETPTISIKIK